MEHKWFYIYAKSSPKYCYFSEKKNLSKEKLAKYATPYYYMVYSSIYAIHIRRDDIFVGLLTIVIDLMIYMSFVFKAIKFWD